MFWNFEDHIIIWIATHRSDALTTFFSAITALGSWSVIAILSVGICIGAIVRREWRFALTLLVANLTAPLLSRSLKVLFGRARPTVVPHLATVTEYSFPSGHALASFVFFFTLALLCAARVKQPGLRAFIIAYAVFVASLVALSRVYLGVHYPSDVVGGAFLGIAWSILCVLGNRLLSAKFRNTSSGSGGTP